MEDGESDAAALIRELREETGLTVEAGALAGAVERPGVGVEVFVIRDYLATVTGGSLAAGDDAADARWCSHDELVRLPLTPGLLDALTTWNTLPSSQGGGEQSGGEQGQEYGERGHGGHRG